MRIQQAAAAAAFILLQAADAFFVTVPAGASTKANYRLLMQPEKSQDCESFNMEELPGHRRKLLQHVFSAAASAALFTTFPNEAFAREETDFVQSYPDFITSDEGFSYKDATPGKGLTAEMGDRVVFDWSGYTIGYFGRPFEAKGGPQGGAFDKDLDYVRTVVGSGTFVKGLEKGLVGMQPGGVRQIVVPYGDLSYPANDASHDKVGPKPTTFSGQRALNFVLENPRVDRTLLFNVKVIRVDKPNGKGGFARG
eukprot:CAMPEP_0198150218 /NCGR_PEP_ID=MMETSP1443-20131203/49972_1 /TAXON_ID=186043 /ORGANISM="Entomoneis sp., Strain CCMP2396" /LENGTH=252 /DNA_ID=CAMNT_0043815471 /DNA_START=30 /DNA_END=788 /DNA_ORIENTATION=-